MPPKRKSNSASSALQTPSIVWAAPSTATRRFVRASSSVVARAKASTARSAASVAMENAGPGPRWNAAGKNGEPGPQLAKTAKRRLPKPLGVEWATSAMTCAALRVATRLTPDAADATSAEAKTTSV